MSNGHNTPPLSSPRLQSIDALRGFDMFWIIQGDTLMRALAVVFGVPAVGAQFEHAEWDGFGFYDLIFPLFLFLVGVVLPFSLNKYTVATTGTPNRFPVYRRIISRTAALILSLIHI